MKWILAALVLALLVGGALYVFATGRLELWLHLRAFRRVIASAETKVTAPGARLELDGADAVRTDKGTLLVSFDTGGGHRGARGFVYCSDPELELAARLKALGFAESIYLEPLNAQWSRYRSAEE